MRNPIQNIVIKEKSGLTHCLDFSQLSHFSYHTAHCVCKQVNVCKKKKKRKKLMSVFVLCLCVVELTGRKH